MERRRLFFLGLAGTAAMATAALSSAEAAPRTPSPALPAGPAEPQELLPENAVLQNEMAEEGDIELAQYYGGPPRRRGPRCWVQTRQVRFRDRWGHWRVRTVQRRVCR
ncbi:hypothetical protein EOD42_10700 [Rhodovarius crocodyli]|uniref:Protamine-2 (Modular protein) n=1 Tax=Rhodovarius crocodyli TaxID=1979269 RepID=A0A437MGZ8_9PROT|nr:hypothetical protein [Rhodovarius crocodyli]RVT96865.1 hypothetical protein EOD42_10700 [Rhodovarius crocodyli]